MRSTASPPPGQDAKRRLQAEQIFRDRVAKSPVHLDALSPQETQLMLHELRVHQIELELQNEELQQTQLKLDAARARYFDLYELAPTGYVTVSEQGLILEANLAVATLLGVPRNTLINQPISRFILKEDQDSYYLHRKMLVDSGAPQAFELRMVKSDRTQFWAQFAATAARCDDGAREYRIVLGDVTERKQGEDALRISRNFLQTLLDVAPVGISVSSPDGQLVMSNKRSREILGLPTEEQLRLNIAGLQWQIVRPDGSPMPPDEFASVRAQREQQEVTGVDMGIVREDGIRWISVDAVPSPDPSYGVIVAYADITERKQAEDVIKEQGSKIVQLNQRLSLAADSAGIGVWEYFVPEDRLIWDKLMYALYGVREQDFSGAYQAWQNGLHLDDKVRGDEEIHQALEGIKEFDTEFRVVWPTGEVRHIKATALVQRDAEGKPLRMTGVNYDITERKQAEDVMKEHNALLTHQNIELERMLSRVRRLEGFLSICMQCKKIRTESNDWHQLERYIGEHSDAVFSHGICPECLDKEMKKLD
jgi:PAS domain S-box-containing protein